MAKFYFDAKTLQGLVLYTHRKQFSQVLPILFSVPVTQELLKQWNHFDSNFSQSYIPQAEVIYNQLNPQAQTFSCLLGSSGRNKKQRVAEYGDINKEFHTVGILYCLLYPARLIVAVEGTKYIYKTLEEVSKDVKTRIPSDYWRIVRCGRIVTCKFSVWSTLWTKKSGYI